MKPYFLLYFIIFQAIIYAKTNIVVSILPQKTFVEKIAQDMAEVTVMVPPGASPHTYEPKMSQMIALSKADLYFSIGVEFETVWLEKLKCQNKNLTFIDMAEGIEKLEMVEHDHGDEHHQHEHEQTDPHIWTAPNNVVKIAQTIYKTLVQLDPKHQKDYKKNLDNFLNEIQETDTQIKALFSDLKPKSSFMVFHPSWGYFANQYDLKQIAVEVEGKNPKPKEIIAIIKEAKEEDVQVIFTQPEFSDKSARIIANESKIEVKKISPLDPKWSQNLIYMAKSIANK